jgi:NADP-dependent alcohol dehydrogenase
MVSFRYANPTEILFGTGQIGALGALLPADARVLLLYGGGSIKRNGVYEAVRDALADRQWVEFGGIEVNPVYETILRAAELARSSGTNFILGVGGGSVIDAAKFLATIVPLTEGEPWDVLRAQPAAREALPVGAVLTLPATGSESNAVSVISHAGRHLKVPFSNQAARPVFAILDPSTMKSLSRRQLENGVVDAFTHVLEQYLTVPVNAPVQLGYSEVLLEVLIEWGPTLVEQGSDEARENVMWAANQALNGLIGTGVPQDWSTHMIGHAITALHGTDHARTLSMVMGSVLRHQMQRKLAMLARYGRRVWKFDMADDGAVAEAAIAATEQFFARMGCPTRTAELDPAGLDAEAVVAHIETSGQFPLGEARAIDADAVRAILALAA